MSPEVSDPMPFTYTPISAGTIRLLVPDPVNRDGGHSWILRTANMDDPDLRFEALSYCWGPQTERLPITLNGQLAYVHHNLHSALPYLAQRGGRELQLPIWIDAISINQEDEEEKMIQISSMNSVYRKAERVWAWLGLAEHQDLVPEAIGKLDNLAEAGKLCQQAGSDDEQKFKIHTSLGLDNLSPALWSVIIYLMANEWFERLWVIQEFALAQDVTFLCGEHEIQLQKLNAAIDFAIYLGNLWDTEGDFVRMSVWLTPRRTSFIRGIISNQTMAHRTPAETMSLFLFVSFQSSGRHECSQAQDRILGLMGLVDTHDLHATGFHFPLAYTSIPDLYTQFSAAVLSQAVNSNDNNYSSWWDWLSLAFTLERNPDLPTWVPDFHHQTGQYVCKPVRSMLGFHQGWASTRSNGQVRTGDSIKQLVLQGQTIDEIEFAYEEIPFDSSPGQPHEKIIVRCIKMFIWEDMLAKAILGFTPQNDEDSTSYDSAQVQTYWQTLTAVILVKAGEAATVGHYRDFQTISKRVQAIAAQYDVIDRLSAGLKLSDLAMLDAERDILVNLLSNSPAAAFLDRLSRLACRQLFKTKQGRLGFVKRGVQPDDVVCVLDGSSTAHVIRNVRSGENGRKIWQFVGESYVNGLMNGEVEELEIESADIVLE